MNPTPKILRLSSFKASSAGTNKEPSNSGFPRARFLEPVASEPQNQPCEVALPSTIPRRRWKSGAELDTIARLAPLGVRVWLWHQKRQVALELEFKMTCFQKEALASDKTRRATSLLQYPSRAREDENGTWGVTCFSTQAVACCSVAVVILSGGSFRAVAAKREREHVCERERGKQRDELDSGSMNATRATPTH